ncbi:MAG TPA: alanine racemase, partial [Micromonosporaceae bacterium]
MWQPEIRVDLGAIRDNVLRLRAGTTAQIMAIVKADGYGHGMVPAARAALA